MCFVSADHVMNGCIKDVRMIEEFLHENILTNDFTAEDYITLGKRCHDGFLDH